MQTFLPYPEFGLSASVLDYRRLGKQRLEALQIIACLCNDPSIAGWPRSVPNHPATKMWRGYVMCLALYYNQIRAEWIRRGYRNTMPLIRLTHRMVKPPWLGDPAFHASHRSSLLLKAPKHYKQFGWKEKPEDNYIWPV